MEINLQKQKFLGKYDCFSADLCVHFEPLLGWQCTYVCCNIRTEKESIYGKQSEYKTRNWHTSGLHYGKEASKKEHFLVKKHCHFGDFRVHFEPLLGWEFVYVGHD